MDAARKVGKVWNEGGAEVSLVMPRRDKDGKVLDWNDVLQEKLMADIQETNIERVQNYSSKARENSFDGMEIVKRGEWKETDFNERQRFVVGKIGDQYQYAIQTETRDRGAWVDTGQSYWNGVGMSEGKATSLGGYRVNKNANDFAPFKAEAEDQKAVAGIDAKETHWEARMRQGQEILQKQQKNPAVKESRGLER